MPPKELPYKVGALVQHNTGEGPVMSVSGWSGKFSGWIECSWFAGKKAMRESFPPESLVEAKLVKKVKDK